MAKDLFPLLAVCAALASCTRRASVQKPAPAATAGLEPYVDLEPGWRIRAIVPITRSGSTKAPEIAGEQIDGSTVTLTVSKDFLGYETQLYRVTRSPLGKLHVSFSSGTVTRDQETAIEQRPTVNLFPLPSGTAHVRLLFLERASRTNHDMAVLSAPNGKLLAALTRQVQANPEDCAAAAHSCFWIPAGIAVRPERLERGSGEWTPAR